MVALRKEDDLPNLKYILVVIVLALLAIYLFERI